MSILIPTPADHNHTTEVFKRTLAEASFLCNAADSVSLHKMKAKKRGGLRYLAALVLLGMAAIVALTGCGKAAPVSMADAKRAAAGAWACPGMHAEWIGDKEVMCLKEKP